MISKELLSVVMGLNISEIGEITSNVNLWFLYDTKESDYINIYELAYRCREWARDKGYEVSACRPIVSNDEGKAVINYWYKSYIFKFELGVYHGPEQILKFDVNVSSEPEAVFRACEYILEEIREK